MIVQTTQVVPVTSLCDLGVRYDSGLSMLSILHNSSVRATESSCVNFAVFAGHCRVLHWRPCRSTTVWFGPGAVCRQCGAARLTVDARRYDHVTQLWWTLWAPQRI